MAYARGTATKGSRSFIPNIYSKMTTTILDKSTVAMECVSKSFEKELIYGDLITIPSAAGYTPTVRDYTVDGTITYETTAETSIDFAVDQQKYYAMSIDYVDEKQTHLDVHKLFAERAAQAMRETVDSFLLSIMAANAPARNTIGTTASSQVLDKDNVYDVFCNMHTLLREANAGALGGEDYFVIVPPAVWGLISKSEKVSHATAAGDGVISKGFKGQFAGFTLKESTNLPLIPGTSSNDEYYNVVFGHKKATQFAMQLQKEEQIERENTFGKGKRGLAVYGGIVEVPGAIGRLITKVG